MKNTSTDCSIFSDPRLQGCTRPGNYRDSQPDEHDTFGKVPLLHVFAIQAAIFQRTTYVPFIY
ncbi:hypothetical protein GJ744_006658 [Endocarpon pusillum]|uniref:Uncharacterized protein n=1 Tax=Endocarpon pusillum TaxID=364733 RepID=A0A8H7AN00_9EURO|nr:hypothetical protein GJ744_006658 [Endocarpon pusillum]